MTELATIADAATRCVLCPRLRSRSPARFYHRANVCDSCRAHLRALVCEVADCYALLPDSLERGGSGGQKVRGGEVEAALPFREDVWDLLLPVRRIPIRAFLTDQIGYSSVATVLDSWADDWCDHRGKGEVGPVSDVVTMVGWMVERVEWACDQHPAVDEFAGEIRDLVSALRRYVGRDQPRPQPCVGVPCRRCDLKTLARLADGSGDIECQNPACRTLYRPDEYQRWTRLVAAAAV